MTHGQGSGQRNNHDERNGNSADENATSSPTAILATCGAIAGIAVLLATIGLLLASPGTIRAICFVCGVIAVASIAVDLAFAKQRRITVVALLIAAVFAGLTGAAAYAGWVEKPAQASSNITNAGPSKALEDPQAPIQIVPPQHPARVGRCLTLNLSGGVPGGEQLIVVNQIIGNSQRYFKPASMPGTDNNSWSISLTIGNQQIPKPQKVAIYAVLMTKWLANYLTTMQQYQAETNNYWVSSEWPPSALIADQISVTRTQITGPKSCPP
jgi:hypothetical protein